MNQDESGSGPDLDGSKTEVKACERPAPPRGLLDVLQFRGCNLPGLHLSADYVTFGVARLLHVQPI